MRANPHLLARIFSMSTFVGLVTVGSLGQGQPALTGPLGGYVFDSATLGIRPILGLPPSAYLGSPVLAQTPIASVAPNGKFTIVVSGSRPNFIADISAPALSPSELLGSMDSPDRIVWAADSSSAVLFCSRTSSLQFIHNVATAALVDPVIDLSEAGPGPVLLAADPQNGVAGIVSNHRGASSLYLARANGSLDLAANVDVALSAGAFAQNGTLYVAAAASLRVWMLQPGAGLTAVLGVPNDQTNSGLIPMASFLDRHQPVALGLGNDDSRLYLADKGDQQIHVYDVATWDQSGQLQLAGVPSTLDFFGASLFLVNARRRAQDPILLLQPDPQVSVIFIPAGD
jgi:hypothetical protein